MATIRISEKAHKQLVELAERQGETMADVAAAAVDRLWRQRLMEELNAYYADLRLDPKAWQRELDERATWAAIEHWDDK